MELKLVGLVCFISNLLTKKDILHRMAPQKTAAAGAAAKKDEAMSVKGDLKRRLRREIEAASAAARFSPGSEGTQSAFEDFDAAELYCPHCRQAVPVIKRLFLILPDGDKYEYRCRFCGTTVGTKVERSGRPTMLIK
jgi:hypothetical protein